MAKLISEYKPSWFYFNSIFGVFYGQFLLKNLTNSDIHFSYERIYLSN